MRVLGNLYPWDVDGDPAAADRVAGLGLTGVALAAAYHAVRAVTPRHPRHRIVTRDAAVYYRPDSARWLSSRLRPAVARPDGSFERAAGRLRRAGLQVTAWVVLTHNSRLGAAEPSCAVENAFGDRYPWALCAGSPDVTAYAAGLAAETAALAGVDAVELEACGWYGVAHGSAHDKTAGTTAGPLAQWLLSLCFCPGCRQAYTAAGADPARLRVAVRTAVDALLAGTGAVTRPRAPGGIGMPRAGAAVSGPADVSGPAALLPTRLVRAVDAARTSLAERFRREVIAAVREAAPGKPVYLHADPDPRATGANPGGDPSALLGPGGADGAVLACWDPASAPALVAQTAAGAPEGAAIAASLLAVEGLGGRPETLAAQAHAVHAAGATELRLYHAGLASQSDLAAIRALCDAPGASEGPRRWGRPGAGGAAP